MRIYKNNNLPSIVKPIQISCVADERGILSFVENGELTFPIARVFWITNVPEGQVRGGHAHKVCAEILFVAQGEMEVMVHDGKTSAVCHLSNPNEGLYIGPNVWCEVRNFSSGAVCNVLCSHPYIAEGYIHDFEEFLSYVNG